MSWLDKLQHRYNLTRTLNELPNHPLIKRPLQRPRSPDDRAWFLPHIEHPPLTVTSRKRRRADDNDDYLDVSDDEWCDDIDLDASEIPTQRGGNVVQPPLFTFTLKQTAMPQSWKNTAHKTRFAADLHQQREAQAGDNLADELTDAIRRALLSAIETQTLRSEDKIHFTLQADAFSISSNHCFQSATFTIDELRSASPRFDTYLQKLSQQLNSSQSFSKGDTFTMDITTIKASKKGKGNGKKRNPITAKLRGILKKSRISIPNTDDLCCARALVTMKAYVDKQCGLPVEITYNALRRGKRAQERLAKTLHQQAGVPEGPCGHDELVAFQNALPDYQIKVLTLGPPHMITF